MRISDWSSDVCSSDLQGIVHFRRTGGFHMGMSGLLALCVHLFSFAAVERAGCRLAPARPLLKDDNQLAGFNPVDPFNENVINMARPPMLATGQGTQRPSIHTLTRLQPARPRRSH